MNIAISADVVLQCRCLDLRSHCDCENPRSDNQKECKMSDVTKDVMRKNPGELSENKKTSIVFIKEFGNKFHHYIEMLIKDSGNTRELSLAKTKLEECVMWAVKGISSE